MRVLPWLLFAFASACFAQSSVREFENRDRSDSGPTVQGQFAAPDELAAPVAGQIRIKLTGFLFSGNHLVATDALTAELRTYIGRELTARDLHSAARAVAHAYLRRGLMARVRVTSVGKAEGVAEIAIEELRVGKVHVEYPPYTRIREELVERILTGGVVSGSPLPLAHLENSIEVLNAQPGIAAAVGLDSSLRPGEVDVTVRLSDRPIFAGNAFVDNHGVREIGQERLGLNLRMNNALGFAEHFAIDTEETAGSSLLSPLLSFPVGHEGMRASMQTTSARFRAKRAGASLDLTGRFERWQATLRQTLMRGKPLTLRGEYALQQTKYRDGSIFGTLQNRRIDTALFRLEGVARSEVGITRVGLDIERGRADLSRNSGDMSTDTASSRIHGQFWRLRWRLGHEISAVGNTLVLRANGQLADRNLDATQQFALGGLDAVRAYPTAEALGDGGWLGTIEWRHRVDDSASAQLFLDHGGIQRNARPWTNQRNRYELSGLGAGLSWHLPERLRIKIEVARQLGGNAGRNVDGSDSDGRTSKWRGWLSTQLEF
ncbi:MAG: ShlB/FhaC/HecB family hemolysin secretion/activation protein [Zoogloea sp.]|nr:ShlB/FhaC/HecB family hemolysin secretion/activation protein [Zoogloea sp.]